MSAPGTPAEARWEELARAAARPAESGGEEEARQLLSFVLAGAPYALPVELVREIVRNRPTTPVPHVPEDVRGVISLRGEILQVIDLRRRLGLPPLDPTRSSRVVVVHTGDGRIAGLLVDAVTEVLSVAEEALRPAAGDAHAVAELFSRKGVFVSVIDLDRVMAIDEEQ